VGLFDALSGKPAARATRGNEKQLWNNLTEGFGLFDIGREAGLGHLQQGMDQGQQYLGQAGAAFQPLSAIGQKYGGATDMYLNAMGVNGPAGQATARNAFQTGPGYQFAMGQGLEALNRKRSAGNMYNSGNADQDVINYGQGMANQEWGNWLKNFQNFINPELQATGEASRGQAAALGQQANLANTGETNIANLWQQDAANRVNLNNMTTQGLTQNATQGANAQMQASGNALGLIGGGLSALTGAAGKAGGFGNLFKGLF
jgi:hypothetical protein